MNDSVKTLENEKYIVKIYIDEDPINPRENDNIGKMICFHKRYNLGDKHDFNREELLQLGDFDKIEEYLIKIKQAVVVLPLYLMDHSGISMSTKSFGDPWDSGMVGFIYADKEGIAKDFKWKRITKERKTQIKERLIAEVEEFDEFLNGDCYGFKAFEKSNPDVETDSCWGFLGMESIMADLENQFGGKLEEVSE